MPFQISDEQIAQFHRDGFLFVPRLFDEQEMDLLLSIARADRDLASQTAGRLDTRGGVSKLALRNELGDTIYSAIVRSRRIVDTMERLLGGEVYHYHHKMMIKEPYVGGAWEWHQDYGYWYNNGCLFPDMGSCMIAVDRASRANGCLQVLKGSHRLGRLDHGRFGEQTGADPQRVKEAMKRLELVYCEMDPGCGLFFHCNTLHCSAANNSAQPRWSLICCYNTKHNDPFKTGGHPNYHPLEKWPDHRVREVGQRQLEGMRQAV